MTDNFDRANGSLGANWTSPAVANAAANGTMKIASNQVGAVTDDKHSFGYWSANSSTSDQYSQVVVKTIGAWVGAIVRAESGVEKFYYGFVFTANDYRIYQYLNGVHTQLKAGTTLTWAVNDTLRVEISGNTHPFSVRLYRNGILALAWTSPDSTYEKTGGSPGVGMYSPAGLNLRLDDWAGGDLNTLHVSDSFNRANGTLGANWTAPIASEAALKIVSNLVGVITEDKHCAAFWNATSFGSNQYSQCRWFNNGASYIGVIVRADAVLDRYYLAMMLGSGGGASIYARWDGAYVLLANVGISGVANNDMMRLEASGSTHPITLTLYLNGKSILSWTSPNSTNVRAGGSPGIGIFSPAGNNLVLDDWEGGNLDPTAVAPSSGLTSASLGVIGQYQKHFA